MDMKMPSSQAFGSTVNGNLIKVVVQDPDEYSGLAVLEITTRVLDQSRGTYRSSKTTQFFLTKEQIREIGDFLTNV